MPVHDFGDFRPVPLPGLQAQVSLPKSFRCGLEQPKTMLVQPLETDDILLRVSSRSCSGPPAGNDNPGARQVERTAAANDWPFEMVGRKGVTHHDEQIEEAGQALRVRQWAIGQDRTMVLLTVSTLPEVDDSPPVREVLALLPRIVESVEVLEYENGGPVEISIDDDAPDDHSFHPFGEKEADWLARGLSVAADLSRRYAGGRDLDADGLDAVFSAWMAERSRDVPAESVANALGAAFGELLVRRLGFSWGVFDDAEGADIAVRFDDGFTAFPWSSVARRIESREPTFFAALFATFAQRVREEG